MYHIIYYNTLVKISAHNANPTDIAGGVYFGLPEGRNPLARIPCLSTQRPCLSVPDCAPPYYKTVHRTVLLNVRCPLRLQLPSCRINPTDIVGGVLFWSARRELNPQSPESESVALSSCATGSYNVSILTLLFI